MKTLLGFALLSIAACSLKVSLREKGAPSFSIQKIPLTELRAIGEAKGKTIFMGGFSGLTHVDTGQFKSAGKLVFWANTDRGPNLEPTPIGSQVCRPFPLPEFQPLLAQLEVDTRKNKAKINRAIPLQTAPEKFVSGLPNFEGADEIPCTVNKQKLNYETTGLDLEGLTIDEKGNFWAVDEYRPSILKIDSRGLILRRYIPGDASALPMYLGRRIKNRGFEATAFGNGKIFAMLQSPLPSAEKTSVRVRILEFDIAQEKVTGEYIYDLDHADHKIGDMSYTGDKKFWVIEQNSLVSEFAVKRVYEIDLATATNLVSINPELRDSPKLESLSNDTLMTHGITAAKKSLWVDLAGVGLGEIEKFEGIAKIDDSTLALVNDNDFGLFGDVPGMKLSSQTWFFLIRRR